MTRRSTSRVTSQFVYSINCASCLILIPGSAASYVGRQEKFRLGLRKEKRVVELAKKYNWDSKDISMAEFLIDFRAAFVRNIHLLILLEKSN
jgi:hypothetical protein